MLNNVCQLTIQETSCPQELVFAMLLSEPPIGYALYHRFIKKVEETHQGIAYGNEAFLHVNWRLHLNLTSRKPRSILLSQTCKCTQTYINLDISKAIQKIQQINVPRIASCAISAAEILLVP